MTPEVQHNASYRLLRYSLFPLFLITVCPPAAIIMWYTNVALNGSLTALAVLFTQKGFFTTLYQIWSPVFFGTREAWFIISIFMITQLLLMRIVPGKRFEGPITPKGNVPVYKANGVLCFGITLTLFYLCAYQFRWFPPTIVYDHFGGILGALNIFSLIFCFILYFKGRFAPSTSDHSLSGNFIFDYYWGTELYPRILGWDIKMFTNCRFGMMGWPIIILSFAAKQNQLYGLSNSMLVALLIQLVYIGKFFWWERGYLRSLDIMHDRAGFYICWGCLVWVPSIYTSPLLYLVNHPIPLSWFSADIILFLGVGCVFINYFADAQRQKVRASNGNCKIWGKKPALIRATYTTEQGKQKQTVLLASGWWGISRHFHYLPEIGAAFLWTVPALFSHFLPYFYVVYLTILLTHRSLRDENRCHKKYGPDWEIYCQQVPSRIIPYFLTKRFNAMVKWRKSAN
ncbi:7-dehydrocholesterol reductase [Coxiella burnetii]|uniref:7-dehydrocholesterol reductase n=1 Tax=Coxiella burnetii (strain Dugway 5J108-111) TaxID=434922 RepID=A9KE97_COXBN|nr:7-dehydrocholesterol reductase [Coxiella burnetii]ABS76473.1 sterol delta-7-reductase [Coxiella burnetii Dugway 5J108-111]OYK80026.1 7-dehydrocholesterol reductase [Coxiella burnetii]OYK82107.1 7-dehydrocholesterol reductase [Coxiella burnetii]